MRRRLIPRRSALRILLAVGSLLGATVFFASAGPASGQAVTGASLRDECQSRLQEYVKKRNPGHFSYVGDPESKKYSCGFSFEDPGEFDRYPSSAQVAFTFCQNAADEKGIKARCEPIARGSTILAHSYREAQQREDAGVLVRDSMRCGQNPLGRWFWTERAFCDMPWHGPAAARGIVKGPLRGRRDGPGFPGGRGHGEPRRRGDRANDRPAIGGPAGSGLPAQ